MQNTRQETCNNDIDNKKSHIKHHPGRFRTSVMSTGGTADHSTESARQHNKKLKRVVFVLEKGKRGGIGRGSKIPCGDAPSGGRKKRHHFSLLPSPATAAAATVLLSLPEYTFRMIHVSGTHRHTESYLQQPARCIFPPFCHSPLVPMVLRSISTCYIVHANQGEAKNTKCLQTAARLSSKRTV